MVAPSDITRIALIKSEFEKLNCQVIACSTDSHFSHKEWTKKDRKKGGLGPMKIPMLGDISQ